ncbi:SRPBCC domain-containing protein [Lentzea sp. NEAU-D13]|uniref:SRPBCC domain-containing protein n=1 Tax=Lentzea alba TaxID=2714351 RepID=A0A7C9VRD1_9PSEU|nr:SRPBCC domain-containing protein [Lentzea alba]NGY60455.1 SRPBCC domain-containing protein [Lentzea alba]
MSALVIESVTVEIDAPASFVWSVLLDYPNYPQWNPYTRAVDTTLAVDSPIDLTLPKPDGSEGTWVSREYIRVVDPPRLLRYDTGDTFPGLLGVRDQLITPLGAERCSYHTFETFTGKYAEAVFAAQGAYVKNGFDSVAHALRDRVAALTLTP